jgi:putative spermidine/putrescine transport system permease protein
MRHRHWLVGTIAVVVFAFVLLPIPVVVWMSFFKASYLAFPPKSGYSTHWYANLGQQTQLVNALVYSLELAAVAAVISAAVGLCGALALQRARLRGKATIVNAFVLPLMVPTIVSGLALYLYLFNIQLVSGLSLVPTLATLVAAHVLVTLPWTFRFIYTGLAGIDKDVERASLDLGHSPRSTLFRITLPLLRSSIVGAVILAFIFSFGDLEMSLFLVGPGQPTLPVAIVQYSSFKVDPTIAAMAVVQIGIIGGLLVLGDRVFHFGRAFASGTKR